MLDNIYKYRQNQHTNEKLFFFSKVFAPALKFSTFSFGVTRLGVLLKPTARPKDPRRPAGMGRRHPAAEAGVVRLLQNFISTLSLHKLNPSSNFFVIISSSCFFFLNFHNFYFFTTSGKYCIHVLWMSSNVVCK